MTGEKIYFEEASANKSLSDARHNDRSTIVFPYLDLDTAVAVARAVYERAGLGDCEVDELAAQMQQTVSGAFRLKTATAKTFGVLEKGDRGSFKLSDLGRRIVSPETEDGARVDAFLNIPLYKAIFEKYRGHLLPPTKALEREMVNLGVAPKQADKARQTFERSARQADFFGHSEGRLVQPRLDRNPSQETSAPQPAPAATRPVADEPRKGGGSGREPPSSRLEYQLIDLLKRPRIGDGERAAIWTLVQFLTTPTPEDGEGG